MLKAHGMKIVWFEVLEAEANSMFTHVHVLSFQIGAITHAILPLI